MHYYCFPTMNEKMRRVRSTFSRGCGSLTALSPKIKIIFADVIFPFLIGLCGVLFIFSLREYFDHLSTIKQRQMIEKRYVPVQHHGIRVEESLQDKIFKGGRKNITKYGGAETAMAAPKGKLRHGAIWSWPDVDRRPLSREVVCVVTPTCPGPYQYAELTRLAQAMYPARKFVWWLVIMDGYKQSKSKQKEDIGKLRNFLDQFGIYYTLMKTTKKLLGRNTNVVNRRRAALQLIRKLKLAGTVYFADLEKTYDSDIFRQMQGTKKISIWPTWAISKWPVSSPILDSGGNVVDFFRSGSSNMSFDADFSSFAFNSSLLSERTSNVDWSSWVQGNEKTIFLRGFNVSIKEFKPVAANATEVLMWHTKTIHSKVYKNNKIFL